MLHVPLQDAPAPHLLHEGLAARHAQTFILESREGPERLARHSIVGFDPVGTVTLDRQGLHTTGALPRPSRDQDPLEHLRRLQAFYQTGDHKSPYVGGLVGSFGYDFARLLEPTLDHAGDEAWPRIDLGLYLDGIVYDHAAGAATYVSRGDDRSQQALDAMAVPPETSLRIGGLEATQDEPAFTSGVRQAQEAIRAGEAFQIVLSRAFQAPFDGDLSLLYRALRKAAAVPYLYHLRSRHRSLLGASPEMLVRVRGGLAETFPIAGTRPLTGDPDADAAAAQEMLGDRKETAEHAMLVDLARNDLARVSRPGTVEVRAYQEVHGFRGVQHLVSHVAGRLRDGADALSALAAVFPAGTVSGAPKVRAMETIDQIEPMPRGAYAGCVAYWSFNGDFDSAITIRSLSAQAGRLTVQAGAGIVHRSDPHAEFEETEHKASAMLAAVRAFQEDA